MIPSATGVALNIAMDETVYVSQTFSIPTQVNVANAQYVVFVQSDNGKEILQTAKIAIADMEQTDIANSNALPQEFSLNQNYPNPFNAKTMIDYSLGQSGNVKLTVYDLAGRLVNTLYNGNQGAGHYQIIWDGKDSNGNLTASGVYFYRLEAEGKSITKRMVMLK